jgi:hypothetical protein
MDAADLAPPLADILVRYATREDGLPGTARELGLEEDTDMWRALDLVWRSGSQGAERM